MENPTPEVVTGTLPVDDETIIHLTQTKRRELLAEFTKNGIPKADEDRKLTMALLNDMDRTALTNKRIKSDEKKGAADELAREIVARILENRPAGKRHRAVIDRPVPVISNEIPEPDTVPGEMETSAKPMDYNSFISEYHGRSSSED